MIEDKSESTADERKRLREERLRHSYNVSNPDPHLENIKPVASWDCYKTKYQSSFFMISSLYHLDRAYAYRSAGWPGNNELFSVISFTTELKL